MALRLKAPPSSLYTGLTPVYNASHRERDDSYSKVILQLAPRWRIIECRNAEQWIIQKRSAEPLDRGKWTGVSYVVSRDKLIDLSTSSRIALRAIQAGCAGGITVKRNRSAQIVDPRRDDRGLGWRVAWKVTHSV